MKKLIVLVATLFLLPVANAGILVEVAVKNDEESNAFNELLFNMWLDNKIYYVMMPIQNEFANEWMLKYNATYPEAFLDGGYRVVKNAGELQNAIQDCMEREKNNINVELKAEWLECPCMRGLNIAVRIYNHGEKPYNGILRVYITEINSRWKNDGGSRYHFSFLEFADVENVSIKQGKEYYTSVTWDTKQHFPDIYDKGKNNVAVIAAVFNKENHYLDGVAFYMPPNVPPYVTISYPKNGYVYIFGRQLFKASRTILIGGARVRIQSWDDHGIKKIELYQDRHFWKELNGSEFMWKGMGFHSLEVIAYDDIQSSFDELNALLL